MHRISELRCCLCQSQAVVRFWVGGVTVYACEKCRREVHNDLRRNFASYAIEEER